jgi:hypothetical protein
MSVKHYTTTFFGICLNTPYDEKDASSLSEEELSSLCQKLFPEHVTTDHRLSDDFWENYLSKGLKIQSSDYMAQLIGGTYGNEGKFIIYFTSSEVTTLGDYWGPVTINLPSKIEKMAFTNFLKQYNIKLEPSLQQVGIVEF